LGCAAAPDDVVLTTVAERLIGAETPAEWPPEARSLYIKCGKQALSSIPTTKLRQALAVDNVPSMWAILGQPAMDRYLKACRAAERPMIDAYENRTGSPKLDNRS
jgi:hypothetical protein